MESKDSRGSEGEPRTHSPSFKRTPTPTPAHSPLLEKSLFWLGNYKIKPRLLWATFQGPVTGMVCRELGTRRVGPPYPYLRSWGVPWLTERKADIGTVYQERAVYNHPPCDLSTCKTRVSGMGCLGREEPARGRGWRAVPQQRHHVH